MAWRDTLVELREELAHVRADRRQQASEEQAELLKIRDELSRLSDSLGISGLLSEMNATLLDGTGEIETIVSWDSDGGDAESNENDYEADLEDDEDDDDEGELITAVLSWEEDGEREIAVEVVSTQDGTALQVNGVDIRPERAALEQALVEAFRDELEV